MILSLRNKTYEERLASLDMFSLEKRRLRDKQIECFRILKGFTNVDASKLFSIDNTSRTKSNGVKLRCKQVQLDSTKFFLTNGTKNKLDHHFLNQGIRSSSTKESGKSKLSDVMQAV